MKVFYHISLPHPPKEVLDEAINIGTNRWNDINIRQLMVGHRADTSYGIGYEPIEHHFDKDKGLYVRNREATMLEPFIYSILPDFNFPRENIGVQTTFTTHYPHTDSINGRLMYRVSGEDTETVWYQEEGQPLVRKNEVQKPYYHDNSNKNLSEYYKATLAVGNWYLLITRVLHGVPVISDPRISLTISLNDDRQIEKLINEYSYDPEK